MELELNYIIHCPAKKPPLLVEFFDGCDPEKKYRIAVDGSTLQSFTAFQRAVLNRLGVFVRRCDIESERCSQRARQAWADAVCQALEDGKRCGEECSIF